jgi:hypothetical protein
LRTAAILVLATFRDEDVQRDHRWLPWWTEQAQLGLKWL